MTESEMDTARSMIRAVFGADVWIDSQIFSSGAVAITIRRDGYTVMVDARPPDEWSMSINPPDSESFAGHDHTAPSLTDLLKLAKRELLADLDDTQQP